MVKKLILILLAAILLSGCGAQKTVMIPGSHFTALREGTEIALGAPAGPVLDVLGAPFGYAESKSANYSGVEKTYRFSGLSLRTYPSDDGDRILGVQITGTTAQTREGITIGASADQVRACYGPDAIRNNLCVISRSKETLVVQLKNDVVTDIRYEMM